MMQNFKHFGCKICEHDGDKYGIRFGKNSGFY